MKHLKSLMATAILSGLAVAGAGNLAACGGSSDEGSSNDAGGSTTPDGGSTSSKDAGGGTVADSAPPHVDFDGGVACGNSSCNPSTEQCCVDQNGSNCIGTSATCQGPASLTCTTTANCTGGTVCCATLGATGLTAVCQATCPSGGLGGPYQLCATDGECPAGSSCQSLGGIHYCGNPFDASAFDASGFFDAARD